MVDYRTAAIAAVPNETSAVGHLLCCSESNPRLQLHNSTRERRRSAWSSKELILNHSTGGVERERGKVQIIEHIKYVHSELQIAALTKERQWRVLAERQVDGPEPRPAE